ncbi:MAG: hypothetical protein JWP91_2493 [Fibrobacteres bacterium]|nr:hypothetical protein [Fibrobacterota bacterium]
MRISLLIYPFIAAIFTSQAGAQALSDARFGTDGINSNHWQWYRNYNQDYNDIQFPRDLKRLWTVGKLDDGLRDLGFHDWCTDGVPFTPRIHPLNCDRESEPPFAQQSRYEDILAWDKAGIRKLIKAYNIQVSGLNTEMGYNGAEKIHISIGNEPNWYPYVKPNAYARVFKEYYDFIKGPSPSGLACKACVIHNGGIILADFKPQGLVLDIVSGLVSIAGEPLTLMKRFYKTGTAQDLEGLGYLGWTRMFLTELAHLGGSVDIFDAHAYDIDIGPSDFLGHVVENPTSNLSKFISVIKGGKIAEKYYTDYDLASGSYTCRDGCGRSGNKWGFASSALGACLQDRQKREVVLPDDAPCALGSRTMVIDGTPVATNMPYNYPSPVVWIDEFGVLKNGTPESEVNASMNNMVGVFKSTPQVAKWFWFKNSGTNLDLELARKITFGLFSSPAVQLYSDASLTTLTSVGTNYLNLQNSAFINSSVPRVSTSPITPGYVNIPQYPQAAANIVLSFDFNNKTSSPFKGWSFGSTPTVFPDGVAWLARCGSSVSRTFTTAEQAAIADARYLVIERNNANNVPGDFFQIDIRNPDGSVKTVIVSSYFGTAANLLEEQGEVAVLDLGPFLGGGKTLNAVQYSMGVNLGLCSQTDPQVNYVMSRAYFTRLDPVPASGYNAYPLAACNFAGVTTIRPDIYASKLSVIPVVISRCNEGTLSLDAASVAKGMTFDGNAIVWRPTAAMEGTHQGVLTLSGSNKTIVKPFTFVVKRNPLPLVPILALLLN